MVNQPILWLSAKWLLGQTPASQAGEQIDPVRNAILLIVLLGLVLLGITLIACIMIGGSWVRRLARSHISQSHSTPASGKEKWRHDLAAQLPDTKLEETIVTYPTTDDTIAD